MKGKRMAKKVSTAIEEDLGLVTEEIEGTPLKRVSTVDEDGIPVSFIEVPKKVYERDPLAKNEWFKIILAKEEGVKDPGITHHDFYHNGKHFPVPYEPKMAWIPIEVKNILDDMIHEVPLVEQNEEGLRIVTDEMGRAKTYQKKRLRYEILETAFLTDKEAVVKYKDLYKKSGIAK